MRKPRNKSLILIFIFAVVAIQLPVSLSLSTKSRDNNVLNQGIMNDTDYLSSELSDSLQPSNTASIKTLDKDFSIFDKNLRQDLMYLPVNTQVNARDCKVIMLFEENVKSLERESIITSIFEDFTIISHYDIISGTYLKVNPLELISKKSKLEEVNELKRIYKSETYESPYILDNEIQINALNDNLYPNWWLSAVGAEGLGYNGSGVRVAVIDTGIYDHPALNIVANQNFVTDESSLNYNDDVGHGLSLIHI